MRPTLELSMIVKDGGPVLDRCLRSVSPFVDRMLVGDTGSSDDSVKIAVGHGAEVLEIPWEGDFSRARNRLLKLCKSDWVLILDADETIDPASGATIRRLIEAPGVYAYHNPRWNYMRDPNARLGFQSGRPNPFLLEESRGYPAYVSLPTTRLFRCHPGVYYEGCVHETVTRRLAALGLATANADFVVHHFGHAEDSDAERTGKDALYHALGERKLALNPEDAQALIEMGLAELEVARRPHAALPHFERACRVSPESPATWLYAGMCMVRLNRFATALERLQKAEELGLRNGVLYQTIGDARFHAGQFEQARAAYEHVAALGYASPLSEAKLGACEVHLGKPQDGISRMKQAVAASPENGELYDMLAAAALLCGNLTLAVESMQARLSMGKLTDFHNQLVSAIQAQFKMRRHVTA
ncbi:MAG TPA: glycosyltransferase [Terracidiphilus sp.]|jgi:Flp pilus assembly protein TadD